jgi:hypothetical protein
MQEQNTNKGGVCRDCLAGFAFAAATRALSDLPVVDLCAAGRVVCEEGGGELRQLCQKTRRIRCARCRDGARFVRRDVSKLKGLSEVQILLPRPEFCYKLNSLEISF